MTTEELERVIEAQAESQNLDFKSDTSWCAQSMAKDFIAMANVRDGGTIVIGVKEIKEGFIGTGVSEENIGTYKIDEMKDILARYTDPSVDFRVSLSTDLAGRRYVIIKIFPFKDIPIISKTSIPKELTGQTIYYRNTNKRVESGPVSNSNDLRDIIEVAVIRMMQRRTEAGFNVGNLTTVSREALDKETDLNPEGVLKKVQERGYWEIRFMPLKPGQIETLQDCLDVVRRSRTRLNWDFPHVPPNNMQEERLVPFESFYQAESDLGARKEFWRIYLSEQFLMYRSLIEDWYANDTFRASLAEDNPPGKSLSMYTSLTFLVTEVFEFLSRLCQNGLYRNGVTVNMTLCNTKNRTLEIDTSGTMPFAYERKTGADRIPLSATLSNEEVIANSLHHGNVFILQLLDKFGFNPPPGTILKTQKAWLNGTFQR